MRCKLGDLCWIIDGPFPENIGKIVKIVGVDNDGVHNWIVESQGSHLTASGVFGIVRATTANAADSQLRPIPPLGPEEDDMPPVERPVEEVTS